MKTRPRTRHCRLLHVGPQLMPLNLTMLILAGVILGPVSPLTATEPIAVEVAAEVVVEPCGPGIVRYHASPAARDGRLPSLAINQVLAATDAAAEGPVPPCPVFQRINGRHAARIDLAAGTSLYGTGEVAGPLLRNGSRVTAWNFDAYGYDERNSHLYQSHPWVLAVRADGTAFGVLADTSYRCHLDLSQSIQIIADGPAFPVIVVAGESPQAVLRWLAKLVGTMPLPPRWALGYHQCRYSYFPDTRVREIADGFRRRQLPCDVIWLDIDYMDGFRSFTFSPAHFPNPSLLSDYLHESGFHTVAIIDPGIKREPGYAVYDSGCEIDAWVKTRQGEVYTGRVWPGFCVFPDFTNATVRRWWGDLYGPFLACGIDGIWNDMNEPAVFDVDGKTMPLDNVHAADPELGGSGPHARYHNVYGMLMARATFAGVQRARPERRPFVLSRANFLGGQRYAAAWTGDNTASWRHLALSIPMVLNLGLSGQPFSGPDIGGFSGVGTPQMFARWFAFGALLPFARGHTGSGNIDKEPWSFGPAVEASCRTALQRRYRLLPYLYTLFQEAAVSGLPVARPLFFADPADPELREVDDAFLLGSDLLVAVQVAPEEPRPDNLPTSGWRHVTLLTAGEVDPDQPVLYLRSGSILPLGPVRNFVGDQLFEPLELVICLDQDNRAEGTLYEDDGESYGYRDGEYRLVRYRAEKSGNELTVQCDVEQGEWPLAERALEIRLVDETGEWCATGSEVAQQVFDLTAVQR